MTRCLPAINLIRLLFYFLPFYFSRFLPIVSLLFEFPPLSYFLHHTHTKKKKKKNPYSLYSVTYSRKIFYLGSYGGLRPPVELLFRYPSSFVEVDWSDL